MPWPSHGRDAPRRLRGTHPGGHGPSAALTLLFFVAVFALAGALCAQRRLGRRAAPRCATLPRPALLAAIGFALASHLLYSCFDLIGRRYTGHELPTRKVMAVNFISYAFNLCLGSLVGGVAFRYRLYSRLGLDNGVITRIVSMSMLTNWLGYMLLARLAVPACIRCSCRRAGRWATTACNGWAPAWCWWRWRTSWPACARATGSGRCAGTSSSCRPGAWPCCSWPCRASTGA